MRLKIDGHTILKDIIPQHARVLDLGCRGFLFAKFMVKKINANVTAVDPAPDINDPGINGITFIKAAACPKNVIGSVGFYMDYNCKVASHTLISSKDKTGLLINVPVFNIPDVHYDIVKIDILGGLYDLLRDFLLLSSMPTQISVLFHEHTSAARGLKYIQLLLGLFSKWYDIDVVPDDFAKYHNVLMTRKK